MRGLDTRDLVQYRDLMVLYRLGCILVITSSRSEGFGNLMDQFHNARDAYFNAYGGSIQVFSYFKRVTEWFSNENSVYGHNHSLLKFEILDYIIRTASNEVMNRSSR